MPTDAQGGCLCGGIRFTIPDLPKQVGICHCETCRRWTGGPMMALHLTEPLRLDKSDTLAWYKSSDWAERGFCSTCGTSLFYRLQSAPNDLIPSAGSLDDPSAFTNIEREIFTDEQPAFYAFAGDQPRMTGPEFIAMVTGEGDPA